MYNLKEIMTRAWSYFRSARPAARRGYAARTAGVQAASHRRSGSLEYALSFAEALHRAWLTAKAEPINAQRIADAKAAAGVTEDAQTWAGWKALGYEVIHGSKALFGCDLIWGSRGDGATYKARFFGASQVQPAEGGAEA